MTEAERLRRYISPLENKEFTKELKAALQNANVPWERHTRAGVAYLRISLNALWQALWPNTAPTTTDRSLMARSLQAMLWTRTSQRGRLTFIKKVSEVEEDGY